MIFLTVSGLVHFRNGGREVLSRGGTDLLGPLRRDPCLKIDVPLARDVVADQDGSDEGKLEEGRPKREVHVGVANLNVRLFE